jgi:hypothetical protein
MGSKTIFYTLETDKPVEQVRESVKKSLMFLGGTVFEQGDGFQVKQGVTGVNFAFTANFDALINMRQSSPNKYEFFGTVNWSPNGLFWACLIIGFFIFGILWIVPLLYLFIDPSQAYQQALFRIQSMLS